MTRPAYRIRFSNRSEPAYRNTEGGALAWARYKVELLAHLSDDVWTAVDHRTDTRSKKWREIHRLRPRSQEAAA